MVARLTQRASPTGAVIWINEKSSISLAQSIIRWSLVKSRFICGGIAPVWDKEHRKLIGYGVEMSASLDQLFMFTFRGKVLL